MKNNHSVVTVAQAEEVLVWAMMSKREDFVREVSSYLGQPMWVKQGRYHVWQGTHPIGLVAHVDTIPEGKKAPIRILRGKDVTSGEHLILGRGTGIGADDRSGVAAILTILSLGYRPTVVLTDLEETGAIGSNELVRDHPERPQVSALIQIDRRGSDDVVYYSMDDSSRVVEPFTSLMEEEFKVATGSFSDISVLAPAWGVAAANVSTGYYREHTVEEYQVVDEWVTIVSRLARILDDAAELPLVPYVEAVYAPARYRGGLGEILTMKEREEFSWGRWNPNKKSYAVSDADVDYEAYLPDPCDECDRFVPGVRMYKFMDGERIVLCPDCSKQISDDMLLIPADDDTISCSGVCDKCGTYVEDTSLIQENGMMLEVCGYCLGTTDGKGK